MTLSHKARAERRDLIAQHARQGLTVEELHSMFGLCRGTIYKACHEHGVVPVSDGQGPMPAKRTFSILADLLQTEDPIALIADRYGLSKTRIGNILTNAREAGIEFPHRLDLRRGQ